MDLTLTHTQTEGMLVYPYLLYTYSLLHKTEMFSSLYLVINYSTA